jgi:TonB-linked SusC/RagA family outer membrane protein
MIKKLTNLWKVCLCMILTFGQLNAHAQSSTAVKGRVTTERGESLPGVSVTVKGTTNGVITDSNGAFTIKVNNLQSTLVCSFIGYIKQEVSLNGKPSVDIQLSLSLSKLDEVVVVGYGTQRRAATTGSITTIKADELLQTPIANIAQGLQARVSGVQITQNSGAPGGSISVRVRGTNSINGSSEPLYIIDGIQVDASIVSPSASVSVATGVTLSKDDKSSAGVSPLNSINPNDIESIEVLKDASAAAIYGSRAANGVVIITTKQGKAGDTKISYDAYYGTQKVNKEVPMLNATQFAQLENDIYKPTVRYADPLSLGVGTNWQDVIFRNAPIENHSLSISGGNEKTKISLGASYFKQNGIIINSDYGRYSYRLGINHQAKKWLKMGVSIIGSRGITNRVQTSGPVQDGANQGVLGAALSAPPVLKPYDANGNFFAYTSQPPYGNYYAELRNPVLMASIYDHTTGDNILANTFFEFTIAKGLTYRASFNVNKSNSLLDLYVPKNLQSEAELSSAGGLGGYAVKNNANALSLLHESILTYSTTIANDHTLKFTGVYSTQKNTYNSNFISANRFPNDATKDEALSLAAVNTVSSNRGEDQLDSYLGRINYGFKNRYFLDLTARVDGSTKFGKNNKYGFFPAIGTAWRIIDEPFLKDVKFLSDLKLRASIGRTGNAAGLTAYQSLGLVVAGGSFSYPINGNLGIGVAPTGIANPDLRWEQSVQTNVGLDVGLFKDRLSFVVDVYDKKTDNLLFTKQLPLSSGYQTIIGNFASIDNKGIELAAKASVLNKKVKWNIGGNISFNRNKLLSLADGAQEFAVNNYNLLKVGYPLGIFKTYVDDGIYQTGDKFLPGATSPRYGGGKEKDVNGDGVINASDQVITGDANPKFIYGFSTDVRYRNFDFNAFFGGVYGNKIFNLMRYTFENPLGSRNALAGLANRWSPTNPVK